MTQIIEKSEENAPGSRKFPVLSFASHMGILTRPCVGPVDVATADARIELRTLNKENKIRRQLKFARLTSDYI